MTKGSIISPPLSIRSANLGDEARVVELWRASNLLISYNDPTVDFQFALAKESSDVLVGVDAQDALVGSVMVGHDGHRGWIYYVACDPNHRHQGVGRAMVEAAEKWLKAKGVVKLMLLVRETNAPVVDFYKHLGFETVPRIVMQKWLSAPADEANEVSVMSQ